MKIQYKAAFIITLFGIVIVILFSLGFDKYSHKIVLDEEIKNLKSLSEEVALHLESNLREKTSIACTMTSAPLIKDALLKSNSEFALLPYDERKKEIDRRNRKWMKTENISDSFIQSHMTNSVAEYLKSQKIILPGEYGEIFLTNRYGVMIATTGKLTTLAHAHKYWWLACYNDGLGRIFLDDRGFDASVQGYVLGVVIPIKDKNGIIGILKSNVNIMGPLTDVVQNFILCHPGRIKIVRTGGLVVSEYNVVPLSTQVNETLVEALQQKEKGIAIIAENNEDYLTAYSPIPITLGSEKFGFGGSKESIDHIKGNKGEAWNVIITLCKAKVIERAHKVTFVVIFVGIMFTILIAFVAMFFGKWLAKPIIQLANTAQNIGKGHLDTRAEVVSNDEIGSLAKSLNTMAKNLQETMTSRDEFEIANHELLEALINIKTLSGLVPICANCKKIRDDKGYWNHIESYLESHTDAQFSHGICDVCEEKLYGDQDWFKKRKKKL